jgi:hypothetical protein
MRARFVGEMLDLALQVSSYKVGSRSLHAYDLFLNLSLIELWNTAQRGYANRRPGGFLTRHHICFTCTWQTNDAGNLSNILDSLLELQPLPSPSV